MPVIERDQWMQIHAIFTFIVPVLVDFIAVKYQGKPNSPFDAHPVTTVLSIFTLFVYCCLFLPFVAHLPAFNTACGARNFCFLVILSFSLSIAFLTSLLFRGLSFFLLYLPLLILLFAAHLHGTTDGGCDGGSLEVPTGSGVADQACGPGATANALTAEYFIARNFWV
ncbi:hypothetical protein NL676_038553 [Syzygium grande]|nr:hypothetical protein NL676_038553 [Syzygium grande]